jgi:hypothetical protein
LAFFAISQNPALLKRKKLQRKRFLCLFLIPGAHPPRAKRKQKENEKSARRKMGSVYAFVCPSMQGIVKIGATRREVAELR